MLVADDEYPLFVYGNVYVHVYLSCVVSCRVVSSSSSTFDVMAVLNPQAGGC